MKLKLLFILLSLTPLYSAAQSVSNNKATPPENERSLKVYINKKIKYVAEGSRIGIMTFDKHYIKGKFEILNDTTIHIFTVVQVDLAG
jgi:hypothetical protein